MECVNYGKIHLMEKKLSLICWILMQILVVNAL
jgi:hypothetical protein